MDHHILRKSLQITKHPLSNQELPNTLESMTPRGRKYKITQAIEILQEIYNEIPTKTIRAKIKLLGQTLREAERPKMGRFKFTRDGEYIKLNGEIVCQIPPNSPPQYLSEFEVLGRTLIRIGYLYGQKDLIEEFGLVATGRDVTSLYPFDDSNWSPPRRPAPK